MSPLNSMEIISPNDPITYSLNGEGFSITADATLSNTSETNLLLLSNPSTSTLDARAMLFYSAIDSTQGILTTRVYTDPTVTNNGNDISSVIVNNYVKDNMPSSVLNAYASSTTTSKGAKRISIVSPSNTAPSLMNFAQTAILSPGHSMLITAQVANIGLLNSVSCHFFLEWVEV